MKRQPVSDMALTVFGLGHMRPAPGTWGSLPPAGLAWVMLLVGVGSGAYHLILLAVCAVACLACILMGPYAEHRFARKDPSQVVADETAGQCIALALLPALDAGSFLHATLLVAGGFLLFRLFDIIKPFPAARLQRLPAGWGILVDDLIAGLYAMIALQAIASLMLT